ncbi:MAG: hypothetical protein O7E52_16130 [Candidatus Poribacteria bacterium]|nr:hypothetical protein [Candidatus Poribacteria bacterium]
MVDDSREEHRMIIFGNDSDPVQERLIIGSGPEGNFFTHHGILERKIHAESYTVTLYALLKDYGLTPIIRIKPRIRFRRSNYDNLSSSAPLRYDLTDIVHFAELKRSVELTEIVDNPLLERVFGDAPSITNLSEDAAVQFVSQRDLLLRQPPFKTKTKVFGEGADSHGIPIGQFLDALNNTSQTEKIFRQFPRGDEFAKDLLEALEPYSGLELQFGLYSRYERRDCVLAGAEAKGAEGYRTTFDPWTALGYVRSDGAVPQLQILSHERGTRWEHKIMVEQMAPQALELLSKEIRSLRQQNLIGRVLSKSQTGLTLLADYRESELNATKDLLVGYDLKVEVPLPHDRFSNIGDRRKLRGAFNQNTQYQLHPLNTDILEKHLNLAKGAWNGQIYTLDNVYLMQGVPPQRLKDDGFIIVREPIHEKAIMRSAEDLRARIPANGFEKCWNEIIDEGGYSIINKKSGRCYTVIYGTRATGSILEGRVTRQEPEYYLSIKYLGITPEAYGGFAADTSNHAMDKKQGVMPPRVDIIAQMENAVICEMKSIISYLKTKRLI